MHGKGSKGDYHCLHRLWLSGWSVKIFLDKKVESVYCHRKFGPLSKTRLWYNIHLLERSLRWRNENEETSLPSFRSEVVLEALCGESSQAELCRCHNLSEDQLSKWKQQVVENVASLFVSTDKHSSEATERIAHLEQLVGRLTLALDIQKKASTWLS